MTSIHLVDTHTHEQAHKSTHKIKHIHLSLLVVFAYKCIHYLHMYVNFVFLVCTGGAQLNTSLVLCLMMLLKCGSALIPSQPN